MPAAADALPLDRERADEPKSQQAAAQSVQEHCDVPGFDKLQIGRDGLPPYNHRGTVVVASAWLAFYIIAVVIASGN